MAKRNLRTLAAAAACWGAICSSMALAAPTSQSAAPADVALADGGMLVGQVVDAQGAPLAQAPVAILRPGREVLQVATNAEGQFSASGLTGGICEVTTPGSRDAYRLWAPQTAPPAARQGMLIVAGSEVVRAQYGTPNSPLMGPPPCPGPAPTGMPSYTPPQGPLGRCTRWMVDHPVITAGAVVAAIVVPLAVVDLDDDAS